MRALLLLLSSYFKDIYIYYTHTHWPFCWFFVYVCPSGLYQHNEKWMYVTARIIHDNIAAIVVPDAPLFPSSFWIPHLLLGKHALEGIVALWHSTVRISPPKAQCPLLWLKHFEAEAHCAARSGPQSLLL